MDPAWTEFGEGEPVLGRPVPSVASEPVADVGLAEGAHRVVAEDLGHNARSRDRRAPGVGPGQAFDFGAERQVAVSEATPRARLQGVESPDQGFAVCQADPVTVDPPGREGYYGDGFGPAQQRAEDLLPQRGPQQFGVVDPGDLGSTEDYGRGHQRSRQRPTSGLIGPGQRSAATQHPCRVESVERTFLWRGAGGVSPQQRPGLPTWPS